MSHALDKTEPEQEHNRLRDAFLGWQCRVRQQVMRLRGGRPDASITPALFLPGDIEPMGTVITVMSKRPPYSKLQELKHLALRTNDPAQWRQRAVGLLSETYYQRPREFSDCLTATFQPESEGAAAILAAGGCRLVFSAFNQTFDLGCSVHRLAKGDYYHSATWWHNRLFNPNLLPDIIILGFTPNWDASSANPSPANR